MPDDESRIEPELTDSTRNGPAAVRDQGLHAFASAELTPDEVMAADSVEFIVRLVIGVGYTDGPSRIVFDFTSTLGTSCPTRAVNEASGYVEAYVSNPFVTYSVRCWDVDHQDFARRDRPPSREAQRMVVLDLAGGLRDQDVVELHWGETSGGFGPGTKVTSVVPRSGYRAGIEVRYFRTQAEGLPDRGFSSEGQPRPTPAAAVELTYRVLPRPPHHLRLIRKLDRALLLAHDRFWNVADVRRADELVDAGEEPRRNPAGVFEFEAPDVHVTPRSLPLHQTPLMHNVFDGMDLYWGDLHTHSAYSIDCAQRARMDMTPADLMDFARFRAGLDFFAVTDHHEPSHGPHAHIGAEKWGRTIDDIASRHEPGRFVVFPGIEFRCRRGDTTVIFNRHPDYADIDRPEWTDIRELWRGLAGTDYLSIPHFHNPGSLPEEEWWQPEAEAHEPVLEIFSDHGSYECEDPPENGRALCKAFRSDRCGVHFLKKGYRYGFVANSDDHKGHAGVNGLTAVFSRELTREAILEAYRARRVYATTNARIRLLFTGNGQLMGSVLPNTEPKELAIDVTGENRLKRVDLFRNGDIFRRFAPQAVSFQTCVTVPDPSPASWYVRVTQIDNHIAFSSPVWFV